MFLKVIHLFLTFTVPITVFHVTSPVPSNTSFAHTPRNLQVHAYSWISIFKFSCTGCSASYVGDTNRHLATRVPEHLTSDKNLHIFQHIYGSETCRALCLGNCFSILDTASTSFQLKIKEALHIGWENPSLNKQVNHVNLTLSF